MIDFYHNDGQIGLTLSGWIWIPIILYFSMEFALFSLTRTLLISKIYYYFKVRSVIKKLRKYRGIPNWWDTRINFFLIRKNSDKSIDIPITLFHKKGVTSLPIDFHNNNTFNDSIYFYDGRFNYKDILSRIERYDRVNNINKVSLNRESILDEIGIK